MIDIKKHYQNFKNYVQQFQTDDPHIQENFDLKIKHTYKVAHLCKDIATEHGWTKESIVLAEIMGLYHDIGRFEQFQRYQTFDDSISLDHAEFGIEILKQSKLLCDLPVASSKILKYAISYHNKYGLPSKKDDHCFIFASLLRDADKLDIYRVVSEYYANLSTDSNTAIELNYPDTGIVNNAVIETILDNRCPKYDIAQSASDMRLIKLAWVYDFHFKKTYDLFLNSGFIQATQSVLPVTPEIQTVCDHISNYCLHKISE